MGSDGLFYTQEQAREIVAYARDRGIRVVPEFDIPGHTSAWFVGYPDLASAPGPFHIEREFGVFDPVMDPTRESTYKFLDTFIGEMAAIFPDHFMHIGGDENNGVQWKANPRIRAFMREHNLRDTAALQNHFNRRLLKILEKHGKHVIGWDEILNPDLPKDIVVQSWRGFDSLATGARNGYSSILSAGDVYKRQVCDVYENDLATVRLGDIAEITLNAYPDRPFKGKVSNISTILDPSIRTAKVRIEVQNPGIMRLGMFVRATFHGQTREMHTIVPSSAVLHMHDRDFVFVPAPDKKFLRVEVVGGDVLTENTKLQEIKSGLKPGQPVVTNALVLDHVLAQ